MNKVKFILFPVIMIITTLLFFIQSCDNTTGIPSSFLIKFLYPNPIHNEDKLTLGLEWSEFTLDFNSIEDVTVTVSSNNRVNNDTLDIIGVKYLTNTMGTFVLSDKYIETIVGQSMLSLQCSLNNLSPGWYKIKVTISKRNTENEIQLYVFEKD